MIELKNLIVDPELINNTSWKPIIDKLIKLGFENIYNDVYYCNSVLLDLETGKIEIDEENDRDTITTLSVLINQKIIINKDNNKSND